ncbi:class I SAM-dependent methyltransferase|uniref:methyltransferase n=1 Tax=Noviherbaspirillum sp. L7-7A TaxID=2850560 RepID=UPI001C2B869C|nr:class I SAM-dependent methyltransferase [Noviherbaspirillum sp. L7-7A]MBV0877696.1 class I SAM-dependent methyltransferase [Noviherbaspirillum sp. L7-7A]
MQSSPSSISWTENGSEHHAQWRSESGFPAPQRIVVADDRMTADAAFRLASEGTAMLWRGDYHNARQLLQAMARRALKKPRKPAATARDAFNQHRQAQSQRARTLGMLLIQVDTGHVIPLRRAPDVRLACEQAYGPASLPYVLSLRELLGVIGAYEWRRNGVPIPALGGERIHPHYGVFSPVRGEYLDLVAQAALPAPHPELAFDIGTGTGVLAAILARRGIGHVVATDMETRALACARENLERLGLMQQVELLQADLFPPGRAPLIACNPPWLPARPSSVLEHAIYDPDNRMLKGFLNGLAAHLTPGGEGWLILSDFAEHLGLRSREELLAMIADAGLQVAGRHDIRPRHPKASDPSDPLAGARAREVTSLWRLRGA